jgi:hypothetical protein
MRTLAAILTTLVLFAACGSPDSTEAGSGGSGGGSSGNPGAGTTPGSESPVDDDVYDRDKDCEPGVMVEEGDDPDDAVTHQPCPTEPVPGKPKYELVEPFEGETTNVRPVRWERALPGDDKRTFLLVYWSGVEPCNVLDRVEVTERANEVVATIYEGASAEKSDVVCIEIAVQKAVEITLDEPLGDRKLVDGAPTN